MRETITQSAYDFISEKDKEFIVAFDALDLTQEERKEVYWSVAELVKNRLEKVRSV